MVATKENNFDCIYKIGSFYTPSVFNQKLCNLCKAQCFKAFFVCSFIIVLTLLGFGIVQMPLV